MLGRAQAATSDEALSTEHARRPKYLSGLHHQIHYRDLKSNMAGLVNYGDSDEEEDDLQNGASPVDVSTIMEFESECAD